MIEPEICLRVIGQKIKSFLWYQMFNEDKSVKQEAFRWGGGVPPGSGIRGD